VAIDHPGGVEGLQSRPSELGVELGRPVLDGLAIRQRFAIGVLCRSLARPHIMSKAREAMPSRRMQ
jgi:hypothetical protein